MSDGTDPTVTITVSIPRQYAPEQVCEATLRLMWEDVASLAVKSSRYDGTTAQNIADHLKFTLNAII